MAIIWFVLSVTHMCSPVAMTHVMMVLSSMPLMQCIRCTLMIKVSCFSSMFGLEKVCYGCDIDFQ
jgi:hypothetical protein